MRKMESDSEVHEPVSKIDSHADGVAGGVDNIDDGAVCGCWFGGERH